MDLISKTKKILEKNKISFKQPIVLAVSGGADSVCLLDIFSKLFDKKYITVAHFDHGLRSDSKKDAEFVKKLCKKYQVSFVSKKAINLKKQKGNLEENARQERYKFLFKTALDKKSKIVFTAHHGDDQLETVLMNFQRGAGYEGLTGMNYLSKIEFIKEDSYICRPFLNLLKKDLINYLEKNNLTWREDATNFDTSLKRNFLRHKILSKLNRKEKREILKKISLLQRKKTFIFRKLENFIKKNIRYKSKNIVVFDSGVLSLNKDLLSEIILYAVYHINGWAKDFNRKNFIRVINDIKMQKSGKTFDLPGKLKVISDYDSVIILRGALPKLSFKNKKLNIGKNKIPEAGLEINLTKAKSKNSMDSEKINFPVFARKFRPGDKFSPSGMSGSKRLKNYFIDEKIPKSLRKSMPIIVDSKGVILFILGLRVSKKVCSEENTKKHLTIRYKKT